MFLSKLFSIFKKKKDNQKESTPAPAGSTTVPPSGVVGGAVGLSQPNQAVTPGADKVAQGPSEPEFPKADVDAASDAENPQPTTVTPASDITPSSSDAGPTEVQPPAEEPISPPDTSEPAPAPEEPASNPDSGDDSQIAV